MNTQQCQNALKITINQDRSLINNFSKLTKEAWGSDKADCIKKMGGSSQINKFVTEVKDGLHGAGSEKYVEIEDKTLTKKPETKQKELLSGTQAASAPWIDPNITANISYYFRNILRIFLGLIVAYFFRRGLKYLLAFIYDVMNASRMEYLKIILPRGDSKLDMENKGKKSKDMKESIGRMSQIYRNTHKLGGLDTWDTIMKILFSKPKLILILHYENGLINFIIGTYPEYRKIIEGALSAQFSEVTIETTTKPNYFSRKNIEIMPLEPIKDTIYPIRTYTKLEDDPLNNIFDALGKIPSEDAFTIINILKPIGQEFNKRAKFMADALYKKDEAVLNGTARRKYVLMPWKLFDFLVFGPNEKMAQMFTPSKNQGDAMIRMVKPQEDACNEMAEEAAKPAYRSGFILISSSHDRERVNSNLKNMISAYNIYKDEYNNGLDQPNFVADVLRPIVNPLWKMSIDNYLPHFFYRHNVFTLNALTSLFHLPDGMYNSSPAIKWLDYKMVSCPDNIPICKTENGYFITGVLAEEYRGGKISKIYEGINHRAIGKKQDKVEKLEEINNFKVENIKEVDKKKYYQIGNESFEYKEKDNKKYIVKYQDVTVPAVKCFKDGVLLGINVYRNKFSPIYIRRDERTRHQYIIGKSGGGKSVFIASLARQDAWNGDGLCVIDPHGDLVEDIMEYIPKEKAKDVIYFDAGNEDRPMGLNLYEIDNIDQADRTVNDATEIFLKMFGGEVFGPRIQEYFKYSSLTLLEDMEEGTTLLDVPRVFTDEVYRDIKTKKVKNPVVKNFWEKTYNAMGDREKQEIIPYFTSKFVSFNTNRLIRNIIGQTKSAFRFRPAMDSGKIILINLSKGKIGELNAQLLGMIIVSQVYNAAMSRANIPQKDRRDFFLYVDEFQNFVSGTFADILSEARKYRLALIMAHQFIAQLEGDKKEGGKSSVKDAVFGNVGTMMSFKVGAPDAEFLEKEYSPILSAQDIVGISNYKAYIKLNINNATSRVFSMNTIWTQDYQNKKSAEILKDYSAKKYGRKREYVDAELAAKLGGGAQSNDMSTDSQPLQE